MSIKLFVKRARYYGFKGVFIKFDSLDFSQTRDYSQEEEAIHFLGQPPFKLMIKFLVKLFIIILFTSECYHLYIREGLSKMNRPSTENYENTAILRAIDSVKRDATFGTAHLIIGVNTAPDNPPAWTFTVQVIVVLPLTSSAVK